MKLFTKFFQLLFFFTFLQISFPQQIGVDIMPASHYVMNKQDMQRLRDEINHDLRKRISTIEENWQANEAIREVSSGVWNLQGSSYPSFMNNNGLGGLGQQAMKEYWENYAKAVDPLNYKRKLESKALNTHAETVTEKIENSMTNINENINKLKLSIKNSNEAAKSQFDVIRPPPASLPKNEAQSPANVDNVEENILETHLGDAKKPAEANQTPEDPNKQLLKISEQESNQGEKQTTQPQQQTTQTTEQNSQAGTSKTNEQTSAQTQDQNSQNQEQQKTQTQTQDQTSESKPQGEQSQDQGEKSQVQGESKEGSTQEQGGSTQTQEQKSQNQEGTSQSQGEKTQEVARFLEKGSNILENNKVFNGPLPKLNKLFKDLST